MSVDRPMWSGLLPMLNHTRGKRSPVTCHLKCADACSHPVPNTTDNAYFRDIASAAISRRAALQIGGAGALALVVGTQMARPTAAAAAPAPAAPSGLAFGPIAPVAATVDAFTVPAGYRWSPIIRWGDPILAGVPKFDFDHQSARTQAGQFGYNNDYTDIIPLAGFDGRRALLVCNHEYTNENIMFAVTTDPAELDEQKRVSMAAHGMSVVELRRSRIGTPWSYQRAPQYNRRITAMTPFAVSGPAAGSALMRTVADSAGRTVLGTLGNCAGGTTPWGTVLSGEENFNGYFRSAGTSAGDKRYGIVDAPTTRLWETIEPRFDARNPGYENEINRFGWIVEVDPLDNSSTPVKHTALGRFKHEGANITVAKDGRVVAYMGDDERFDYLYKFVSKNKMRTGGSAGDRAFNKTLLTEGDLYVARFTGDSPAGQIDGSGALPADGQFDGTGVWIPLVQGGQSKVSGFTVEQVLVYTRLAADAVAPTKMDRCEDVEGNPITGKVYVVCTNNTDRGKVGKEAATEPNPRNANKDGHIVEITEALDDAASVTFDWNIMLVCGDPASPSTYFAGYDKTKVSPISCPDNVAFDSAGNMWIATDGMPSALGYNDGLFKIPLTGAERGRVQQFLAVPREAETCGPKIDDVDGMVYVAVQHPGENGTTAAPRSYFPDYLAPGSRYSRDEYAGPRPAIVQVFKA